MEHSGTRDTVADFAGGAVADDLTQALAAQKEQRIADFEGGIIEALTPGDFADVLGGDGDLFAAVKLQEAFVTDFVVFHGELKSKV
jgi:hypothetical protein